MAFTQGIRGIISTTLSQGSFVNAGSNTYSRGFHVLCAVTTLSSGSYVASGFNSFSQGLHVDYAVTTLSGARVTMPPFFLFSERGIHCTFVALPQMVGDETRHICMGYRVDFRATPRYGKAPLDVQFIQLCTGVIRSYIWSFGDKKYGYASDPEHIYKRQGVYDVILQIRIGNVWFSHRKRKYIKVVPGGIVVSRTNRYIRHAITPDQGIGFYTMPVTMPMPEGNGGAVTVFNSDNQILGLVLDAETGNWYDITTRSNNSMTRYHTDKNANQFDRYILLPEDMGTDEKDFLRMLVAHLYFRPYSELNRNAVGYDAAGYPDDMQITVDYYVDGEPTTPNGTMENVPQNGDLKIDKKIEGHRIQAKITTTRGDHIVTGRLFEYAASRRSASPALRVSSEMGYQEELASTDLLFWMTPIDGVVTNRVTGAVISTTAFNPTIIAGPSGISGIGMEFTGAKTVGSYASDVEASVLFWAKGSVTLTINGDSVGLTEEKSIEYSGITWKLYSGTPTSAGSIVIDGSAVAIADLRIFAGTPSDDAIDYYGDDVESNNGSIVLP